MNADGTGTLEPGAAGRALDALFAEVDGLPAGQKACVQRVVREVYVRRVEVRITGGEAAHDLTTQFGARIPDRNGPDEIRRHVEIGGRPALVKWSRATGLAEARMLVVDLYFVVVTVRPADDPDAAQAVLAALDLAGLAALR